MTVSPNFPVVPTVPDTATLRTLRDLSYPRRRRSKSDCVLRYQDQKLRAIGRLTLIASALSVLLSLALLYPEQTNGIVSHLPLSRNGDEYVVLIGILGMVVPICWAVLMGLILTSPEQEVRLVRRTRRWRKHPIPFEAIEFDVGDPNYRKPAWRYFIDRGSR